MAQPVIQTSFNAGEWAPALNARVDLTKYHASARLLKNYFVDYRGGASSRPGTKYILQAFKSAFPVRLIGFQASFDISYVLEFGELYLRFYADGSPVLETSFAISGATQANPAVLTIVGNNYAIGDWIFVTGVVGMTQLNNRYFAVTNVVGNAVTIADLNGVPINSTAYTAYGSVGTTQRVYTIPTPYLASDLALLKFVSNVNNMILTHPSYGAQVLNLVAATNWTLTPISYGTTAGTPTGVSVASTLGAGTVNYSYVVTAVDASGQESIASTPATLLNRTDLRTVAGTNRITWSAVTGAVSYNVYKAILSYTNAVATGAAFGYIGNCTGLTFDDSNISPDFSVGFPVARNPFQGASVASIAVTAAGSYTTVPGVTLTSAPSGGVTATASAVLGVIGTPTGTGLGTNYNPGDILFLPNGVSVVVATVSGGGTPLTYQPMTFPGSNPGAVTSGTVPSNPVNDISTSGLGNNGAANLTWGVTSVQIISNGAGYLATPTVTFSAGAATAAATLGAASAGNPCVPQYYNQRLVLAGQTQSPQAFHMSQPGLFYNFNISDPIQPDDAISGVLVSQQLNTIKSMIVAPPGLVTFTDKAAWLINGGTQNTPVSPANIVANTHAFGGASDVPPIQAVGDIIYVQSKGSIVRYLSYNFDRNIFTGLDISVLSSHLFYGHSVLEWAWAEEPFKLVWAVRDDGTMLILTFLKEQELIAWTHSETVGEFKSVCSIVEQVAQGSVDAVYTVVERVINGFTVKYIERVAERIFPNGAEDAWCVDAGLQYSGAPATTFSGAEHLAGETVTGLADGIPITPFVMATNGSFTLPAPASKVTVGLAFTPDLQTLPIDLGQPTAQGKMKSIPSVTVRVQDTLGLQIGKTFSTLVAMKDLALGNVGSATNEVVTGLVTGDAMTVLDPSWTVPGQYCIRQPYPLPVSILGVIPEIVVGDTK